MERRDFLKTVASGVLVVGISPSAVQAINSVQSPAHSSCPELRFRENGRFKIMQMTDTHYKTTSGGGESTLELMRRAIQMVQPDLIVLTGDIIMTPDTRAAWTTLSGVLSEGKIPWAVVFGNHDQEFELTKPQIIDLLAKQPYNLTENGPKNISGNSNYILQIRSSKSPKKTGAALYCFDSGQKDGLLHPEKPDWAWIHFDQIDWYRKQSAVLTAQNGGEPLPALAFFHIPFPEYREVIDQPATVGLFMEKVSSPVINSGLFTSMCECKDVMGTFVGHDHTNNYIGCLHNICLAYGYVSGRQASKGFKEMGCGVRIIELFEGERKFNTWLLQLSETGPNDLWNPLRQVEPKLLVSYPDSFKQVNG
ncbi:3' 5'-cyclic adenosine monophosphate phosphodiesterase CpdA [termite gut metagenome]|uniref:3' 5'-cyclic adenosine monophosphate phosphodiesterase CpdA n=1 Tax=termite gut metagenome TaxID=433724 RepID=A0A5J4SIZ3_9ZZZZ